MDASRVEAEVALATWVLRHVGYEQVKHLRYGQRRQEKKKTATAVAVMMCPALQAVRVIDCFGIDEIGIDRFVID